MSLLIPELPKCTPSELAAAVTRTISGPPPKAEAALADAARLAETKLPSGSELRTAAQTIESHRESTSNVRSLAWLEAPYLVAVTDGLDAEERQAFSVLIGHIVGDVSAVAVCKVLDWFDRRLAEDGLEMRMSQIAEQFTTRREREQVLGFSILLALADHILALPEQRVLLKLAAVLGFSRGEVQMLVHHMSLRLERSMAAAIAP